MISPHLPAGFEREQMAPSRRLLAAPSGQRPVAPVQAPSSYLGFVNELDCLSANPPDETEVRSRSSPPSLGGAGLTKGRALVMGSRRRGGVLA